MISCCPLTVIEPVLALMEIRRNDDHDREVCNVIAKLLGGNFDHTQVSSQIPFTL